MSPVLKYSTQKRLIGMVRRMMNHIYRPQQKYIHRIKTGPTIPSSCLLAAPDSPQAGFEQLFDLYENPENEPRFATQIGDQAIRPRMMPRIMPTMAKFFPRITKAISKSFKTIESYFENFGDTPGENKILDPQQLWTDLTEFARVECDIAKIGFTELPPQLIFRDKAVLFRYVLVCIQEMHKEAIDLAPTFPAGKEIIRVYATLGESVNKLADWLRARGVRCQAHHPLHGLVLTPPLAGKAGLGWQGSMGLLITPEFGPLQRLAPIFVESPIFTFTDSSEHRWIEEYCKKCGACRRICPTQAIYPEKHVRIDNVPGIGQERICIDITKCFPQFMTHFGCSLCMKVCPFSGGRSAYNACHQSLSEK
jgi:ferredoxin